MAFTQEKLDALEEAIADGARVVKFSTPQGTREVQYHSLAEMLQARDLMRRELGLISGRVSVRLSADKGLG